MFGGGFGLAAKTKASTGSPQRPEAASGTAEPQQCGGQGGRGGGGWRGGVGDMGALIILCVCRGLACLFMELLL